MNLQALFDTTADTRTFSAGTTVFEEGSLGSVMYVVLQGNLEIRIGNDLVEAIGTGDIVGEMALIEAKPRSASAVAVTDCLLARVDMNRFLNLTRQSPEFALHVMGVLANRLRRMDGSL